MTLTEKKALAEWMGWKYNNGIFHYDYPRGYHQNDWNPDTDHKHFAEVLEKLNDEQIIEIEDLLNKKHYNKFPLFGLKCYKWISNNLPAVMDAVLEVLGIKEAE